MVENNWRALYKAAILETDPVKLELRVKAVEDGIRARQALDGQVSSGERAEMKDAHFILYLSNTDARLPVLLEAVMPFAVARVELVKAE